LVLFKKSTEHLDRLPGNAEGKAHHSHSLHM
jgi:hypothetical protein